MPVTGAGVDSEVVVDAVGVGVAPVGCPRLTGIGAAEVVGGVVVSGVVVVVALLPDEQPSSTAQTTRA